MIFMDFTCPGVGILATAYNHGDFDKIYLEMSKLLHHALLPHLGILLIGAKELRCNYNICVYCFR